MTTAVVTGGGQGLGRAVVRRLAADGYSVVVVDIDGTSARAAAEEVQGRWAELDVADAAAVHDFASGLDEVDVLVNNAGIWRKRPLRDSTLDELREVVEVNLMGTVIVTRALVGRLEASSRPAIVNLSSGAVVTSSRDLGTYPASKAAVEALTRQWAVELAPVRVNAVGPGMIVTEGTAGNYEGDAGLLRARAVPLGRVGQPDDVADVIAFLVGPDARYVSGQVIYVDGGLSAGR